MTHLVHWGIYTFLSNQMLSRLIMPLRLPLNRKGYRNSIVNGCDKLKPIKQRGIKPRQEQEIKQYTSRLFMGSLRT